MGARAMWKGRIALGDDEVPVKLYSAVKDEGVHFRLLHKDDLVPIEQRMVEAESGREVDKGEIQRGAQDERGHLVRLSDEELAALEPEPSREIEVLAAVPDEAVGPAWVERPYFLGPDGDPEPYASLRAALEAERRTLVCRWVMRKKERIGVVRLDNGALALMTLRRPGEVLAAPAVEPSDEIAPSAKEIGLAEKLVEALAAPFEPEAYADEYKERVVELARRRAEGEVIELPKPKRREATAALEDALSASLEQYKKAG